MKKLIVLLGALMLVGLGASFGQTALDPTSPYDHTLGREVLTLQRWALTVDQAFEDAASSTNGVLASNTVYIGSSANLAVSQPITGVLGISTGGVTHVVDGTLVNADLATNAAIAATKLAAGAQASLALADSALQPAGNLTGSMGAATTAGVVSITSGSIVNADLSAAAAVAHTKLAAVAPGYLLVGNAASQAVAVAVSGDATLATNGALAFASGAIVNADVNSAAAIASTKLAGLALVDTNTTVDVTINVPLFAGQVLVGSVSNKAWVAKGTTTNDWIAIN